MRAFHESLRLLANPSDHTHQQQQQKSAAAAATADSGNKMRDRKKEKKQECNTQQTWHFYITNDNL